MSVTVFSTILKDISTACRQKGLLFPRYLTFFLSDFTNLTPKPTRSVFSKSKRTLVFFGRFGNVWANSLARDVRRIRGKKGFSGRSATLRPLRTAPATVTHHAYLQHCRHLRARPHRRERCRLHRRRRRHPERCGHGWRHRRLPGTSPRAIITVLCRSLRERVGHDARARARRAGDLLTSRARACVRDESPRYTRSSALAGR